MKVLYKVISGSRAYNLEVDGSDTDVRYIFTHPLQELCSLHGYEETIEDKVTDTVGWELRKFLLMALKANPNVLEILYVPEHLILETSEFGKELRANRERFMSKAVLQSFGGYAYSQYLKASEKGKINWKAASHSLRLMQSAILMANGEYTSTVSNESQLLRTVRAGLRSIEDVDYIFLQLNAELTKLTLTCKLPAKPDTQWAEEFLWKVRQQDAQT